MKKAFASLSALTLALALCLSLCACGQKREPTPTEAPTQAPTEVTQEPSEEVTQAPTTKATKPATKATKVTQAPTKATQAPTTKATQAPTTKATQAPTTAPTTKATQAPTTKATVATKATKATEAASTFSAGETWIVPGEFEFTINSVTRHNLCDDSYSNSNYGLSSTASSAVIVDYTYKNLGSDKLEIDEHDIDVYDANGAEGDSLFFGNYCDHGIDSRSCITGGSCTVKLPVALENGGTSVTIYVETRVSSGTQKAIFKLSVDEPSAEDIQAQAGYSQVKGEFTYKYNDFVGTRGDSGAKVLFIPKNTALKTQDNKSAMMFLSGKYDNGIVVEMCDGYGKFDTGDEVITAGEYVVIVASANTNSSGKITVDQLKQYLGDYISDTDLETLALFIGYSKCVIDTMELKKGYVHTISNDFGITYF